MRAKSRKGLEEAALAEIMTMKRLLLLLRRKKKKKNEAKERWRRRWRWCAGGIKLIGAVVAVMVICLAVFCGRNIES